MKKLLSLIMSVILIVLACPISASASPVNIITEAPDVEIKWKYVDLGFEHSMAISEDNALYTWGRDILNTNYNGRTNSPKRETSNIDERVVDIASSSAFDAAVTPNGKLYIWGENRYGDGNYRGRSQKILENIWQVDVGEYNGAAITTDYELYMWGSGYTLGNGVEKFEVDHPKVITPIKIMDDVEKVSVGSGFCAAIKTNGDLYVWGYNNYGQLGDGTTNYTNTPKKIMNNVAEISLGGNHSAAIKTNGDLYMWGNNDYGQLGNSTNEGSSVPIKIMSNVKSVSLGIMHSAAITENGDLYTWGSNSSGQLGSGFYNYNKPKKIMKGIAQVSLGGYHSAAITEDGDLYMWGSNYYGELGDGTLENSYEPEEIKVTVKSVTPFLLKSSRHYNNNLSALCAEMSDLAYSNDGELSKYLRDNLGCYNITNYTFSIMNYRYPKITFATTYAKVYEEEVKVIFVVLRGTFLDEDCWDLLTDAFSVIDGFSTVGRRYAERLTEYFENQNGDDNTRIVITGHSLGGAVAGLLGQGIDTLTKSENAYIYTFASPNYTKSHFSYDNIFNIINKSDFVTYTPFSIPTAGLFGKSGINLFFDEDRHGTIKNHVMYLYKNYVDLNKLEYADDNFFNRCRDAIFYRCPVDVEVYNKSGNLIAKTEGRKATYFEDDPTVLIQIYNDEKYIYADNNAGLSFKVIGTDSGTMECGSKSISCTGEVIDAGKEYSNIAIEAGKTFEVNTNESNNIPEIDLYVTNENNEKIMEVATDGTETPHIHKYEAVIEKAPSCIEEGLIKHICTCRDSYTETAPMLSHNTKTTTQKATLSSDGKIETKCTTCGKVTSTKTIAYPKTITLSATSYTYDGKVKKPSVTVKDSKGNTIASSNYTVSYASGRKNVGKYAVKITFKGNYSGTKTLYFTIVPKATSISSVTAASKGFTVKWKKQATQTTGYEIQYATDSKFTKNKKTVTVSKNSTTSKKVTKLKSKTKYYVRVRTYKTVKVNGKSTRLYSGWSKSKSVTTKK